MSNKSNACAPDCYTKGRGCTLSKDGRCIYIFAKTGEPNYYNISKKNFSKNIDFFIKEKYVEQTKKR